MELMAVVREVQPGRGETIEQAFQVEGTAQVWR